MGKAPDIFEGVMQPELFLADALGAWSKRIEKPADFLPALDQAIALARFKPGACLIVQRPQVQASLVTGRDFDWATLRAQAIDELDQQSVPAGTSARTR